MTEFLSRNLVHCIGVGFIQPVSVVVEESGSAGIRPALPLDLLHAPDEFPELCAILRGPCYDTGDSTHALQVVGPVGVDFEQVLRVEHIPCFGSDGLPVWF